MSLESVARAAQKLLTAKLELEIAELRSQLAKEQQRNTELRGEIRRRDEMTFRPPFYFKTPNPVPLCQVCWEVDRVQLHLDAPFRHTDGGVGYPCRRCQNVFRSEELLPETRLAEYVEETPIAVSTGRSSLRETLDKHF